MTTEELRKATLDDADAALALPRWALSQSRRMRVGAQRSFWSAADAPLDKLLSLLHSERTMAVATVNHEIPDALVSQAAAYGITFSQIVAWVEKDGPLVIQVLTDFFAMLRNRASVQELVGTRPFIQWLLAAALKYGPVAEKVLVVLLPLLGL